MLLGFVLLAFGIMLVKRSGRGLPPWGVFHEGLSIVTPLSFGVITQLVGLVILILSVLFLKTKIGIGTILNVVLVGFFIDLFDYLFAYQPDELISQIILFTIGIILMTFGRSLYISAKLGSGPRDGVFVGLARVTKIDVKYVKPTIEFIVLFIGVLLGGTVGFGTVIAVLINGYIVQLFMTLLKFDPKAEQQHNIFSYTKGKH